MTSLPRAFLVAALAIPLFAVACEDTSFAPKCKNIPTGGCPAAHGAACKDATCTAAYVCTADGWVLDHPCPASGALPPAKAIGSVAPPPVAPAPAPVSTNPLPTGANGGPGCGALQSPDCSLGAASACPAGSGCCGCEDIFLCQANVGWLQWGVCDDKGLHR